MRLVVVILFGLMCASALLRLLLLGLGGYPLKYEDTAARGAFKVFLHGAVATYLAWLLWGAQ